MYMCIYFLQRVRSGEWKGNVVCMSTHVLNMYMYIDLACFFLSSLI